MTSVSSIRRSVIMLMAILAVPVTVYSANGYYTEPQLYGMRPNPRNEQNLGPIGATGIRARIYKGVKVTVESIDPGTPADNKFTKGDVILGVNGASLKGKNPLVILGQALTLAEAKDGKLTFDIAPAKKGGASKVTVKIPVLGAYAKTFPLACDKSKTIIKGAAEFYAGADRLKGYNMWNALACLFLLSTGDDNYVPRVKEYFSQFLTPEGTVTGIQEHSWFNGYNGVACAEYFLRTGDASVMPIIQYLCDDASKRQRYGVGWGHWGSDANPAYESGGGMQHAAGTQILLTLVLGKACGAKVDEETLKGALTHWYRFAGHGAIPIADQRYWHIFRGAGRDGATAAVMQAASLANGDVSIYTKARDYLAMSALTSWPARNYDWEVYWHSLSGQFVRDFDQKLYQTTMDRFQWRYDLGRNAKGGFEWPHNSSTKDAPSAGICLALAFTAPLKNLQITGAPRSKHAVEFAIPEHLWGTEADLAFLEVTPAKGFDTYGKEEEIHVPYWTLPTRLRYEPGDVKGLPLDFMLKNVRHARCEVRMAAAKALAFNGKYDELEKLLSDPDPRLRRAGLDGINDCRPWFASLPVGKHALAPETFTPTMSATITRMMNDPEESWFVVDGAMQALSHAPVTVIEANIPKIVAWTTSSEWWLRESAFMALMGLQRDEGLFEKHLPIILEVMTNEYRYNPRHKMLKELEKALVKSKPGSEIRRQIGLGFARAAIDSKVLPNKGKYTRAKEGGMNVVEVTLAAVTHVPETAADLAESLAKSGRLAMLETDSIMKIVETHDNHAEDGVVGLYPCLKKLSAKDKARVTAVLYDTFRPELMKRLEASDKYKVQLLDMLITLYRLKNDAGGWKAIGTPAPQKRTWKYLTYDAPKKEQLHLRIGPPKRLRETTLPKGMAGWQKPGFDDGNWLSGLAPIGKGDFKARGHGRGHVKDPNFFYKNRSEWGDGEFIVMRTTFTLTTADLKKDYHRLMILSPQGYDVYVNGEKIHTYIWFNSVPKYREIILGPDHIKHFKTGVNTLAVKSVLGYHKDRDSETYNELGQVDAYFEALSKSDLGL